MDFDEIVPGIIIIWFGKVTFVVAVEKDRLTLGPDAGRRCLLLTGKLIRWGNIWCTTTRAL
jgi:hypothetical protein